MPCRRHLRPIAAGAPACCGATVTTGHQFAVEQQALYEQTRRNCRREKEKRKKKAKQRKHRGNADIDRERTKTAKKTTTTAESLLWLLPFDCQPHPPLYSNSLPAESTCPSLRCGSRPRNDNNSTTRKREQRRRSIVSSLERKSSESPKRLKIERCTASPGGVKSNEARRGQKLSAAQQSTAITQR